MSHPSNLPECNITPESALRSRRRWLKWAAFGGAGLALGGAGYLGWRLYNGTDPEVVDAGRTGITGNGFFPATPHPQFQISPLTPEPDAARYCNFYEFTGTKMVWRYVQAFQPTPWTLRVDGLAAKPQTFDLDDLFRAFPLEERIYRHRCVETWAMVVPWTGFSLATLLKKVEPLPEAKFVRFVSFQKPEEAAHQQNASLPWPYTEGLTLAEATNELSFVAVGMYGHPLLKQNGAPVRLVVPWKYGYKSAKSIVRIELTAEQPKTFWNTLAPHEYGFESNVNPQVAHPRWSQASEWMLGTGERRATELYNGYGEWVAKLYR